MHLLTLTTQRNQISQGHKFKAARTHKQTGTNSMQYANASWGDTPANAHLSRQSRGLQPRAKASSGPRPDTLAQKTRWGAGTKTSGESSWPTTCGKTYSLPIQILSLEPCFILFQVFPFLFALAVGGPGFKFCVLFAGWRHLPCSLTAIPASTKIIKISKCNVR